MTSWENYEEFLENLGVSLLLRKLALGTPIVEVSTASFLLFFQQGLHVYLVYIGVIHF